VCLRGFTSNDISLNDMTYLRLGFTVLGGVNVYSGVGDNSKLMGRRSLLSTPSRKGAFCTVTTPLVRSQTAATSPDTAVVAGWMIISRLSLSFRHMLKSDPNISTN
jgi:hypothetical protein